MKKRRSGIQKEKHPAVDVPTQKWSEEMPKNTEQQLIIMWP